MLGARAHGIILDDALTQEESESALVTDRAWSHLTMTIENRLHPGGWLLGVGTRWTADDLIGRARRAGWPVYRFPALGPYPWLPSGGAVDRSVDPGLTHDNLVILCRRGSTRRPAWAPCGPNASPSPTWRTSAGASAAPGSPTVWQGVPTGVGAGIFRDEEWFRPLPRDFDVLARRLTTVMHVDLAFSEKKTADFTAAVTGGYDPADPVRRIYVTHLWRQKVAEDGLAAALADHIALVKPALITVEVPAFRQEATLVLVRAITQLLIGRHACQVLAVPVSTDKVVRARAHAGKAEAGDVCYDKGLPLWPIAQAELLAFPGGEHDDLVDAFSGMVTACLYGADALSRGQSLGPGRPVRFG